MQMFKYSPLFLIVLLLGGCFGSGDEQPATENDVAISPEKNGPDSIESISNANGYLQIFDAEYPQNVIANRMEKNIALIEGSVDKTNMHLFPSAGIHVQIPDGMSVAERFTGFVSDPNAESVCSFMLTTNPFSMKKTTSQIVSDAIRTEKVKIVYTKDIEVDGRPGEFYLTVEPIGELLIAKHIIAFGDDDFCWIATCTFDEKHEEEFGEALLQSILNLRISEEPRLPPGEDVDFTMTPENLVLTDGFIDKLVFTKDGVFPVEDTKAPVFQAAKSLLRFNIKNKQELARAIISPSPLFGISVISSEKKFEADGIEGYEYISIGEDHLSKEPLYIYSVTLFDELDTYVIHGWFSSDIQENYVDEFRSLAKSFKRKSK